MREEKDIVHPDVAAAATSLTLASKELSSRFGHGGNVFDGVVFSRYPQLSLIRNRLAKLARNRQVHLTGSGPTLFIPVEDPDEGKSLKSKIMTADWTIIDGGPLLPVNCWVVKSLTHGVRMVKTSEKA